MIDELAESALEEIKRADHSIYVSLKYTRTVDIIKNTIKRLLSAYDITIIQALEFAKEKRKLPVVPTSAMQRAKLVAKMYPGTKRSIDFYFRMKNIDRAEFTKKEEYRKNVALIAKVASKKVEVDTVELRFIFDMTVCFLKAINEATNEKTFVAAQRVTMSLPVRVVKKVVKKDPKKDAKKGKGKNKKVVKKAYKVNPHAPRRFGF